MVPVKHDPYGALRVPAFRWFVISLMAMTVGVQIQGIAVAWQLYAATNDPLALGLAGLAEVLPFLALSLPSGQWADRYNRKTLALIGIGVLVLCAALFLAMTVGLQLASADGSARTIGSTTWSSPLAIYAVLAVSGVARAILQPARQALGTMIVPASLYANAATWRSSTWQFASVLGPAIGGLVFAFAGALPTYALTLGLLVLAFWGMSAVQAPARMPSVSPSLSAGAGMLDGVRFVMRDKLVLAALSLDMFAVLFGGATALLPVFTKTVLHVSPEWLGFLRAAPAVGAVCMALLLAHLPPMERAGRTLLFAVFAWGLSIIGFALSRNVWLSCALLALGGAVDGISVVIRSTLLQARTPPHVMGRVMAVNSIFIGSANEIGAFESGVTARLFGAVNSVLLGGIVTIAVVLGMAVLSPTLRNLGPLHGPDADEP